LLHPLSYEGQCPRVTYQRLPTVHSAYLSPPTNRAPTPEDTRMTRAGWRRRIACRFPTIPNGYQHCPTAIAPIWSTRKINK
jgi:hypothetical protein